MGLDIIIQTPEREEMISNPVINEIIIKLFSPLKEEELLGKTINMNFNFRRNLFACLEWCTHNLEESDGTLFKDPKELTPVSDLSFVQSVNKMMETQIWYSDSNEFKIQFYAALEEFYDEIINDNIYDVILYDIELLFQMLVHLNILKYRDDQVTFDFWI